MIDVEIDAEEVGGRYLGKPSLLLDYFEQPEKKALLSQPYDQPLRQRCQRKCCAYTLWTKYIDANLNTEQQLLVPLQNVHIKGVIHAGHAMIDIELTYKNIGDENPIECTFEFPLDNKTLVSRLVAHIDDKTIEAKIKEKEEAKQQYSDAVASGNTAVYAQRSKVKNEEAITLVLGNLLPHQTARVEIQMVKALEVENGSYLFLLPTTFLPQYKLHPITQYFNLANQWFMKPMTQESLEEVNVEYTFSYSIDILSNDIVFVSAPQDTTKTKIPGGYRVEQQQSFKIPKREIKIYHRTNDMLKPQLKYKVDNQTGEVACLASFVPTFHALQSQGYVTQVSSEAPEELQDMDQYLFIFLVDRSGSMSGSRMDLTKEALKLFIQSLPVGCSFAILGFGDKALFEVPNTDKGWSEPVPDAIWQYNEKTRESILKNISSFQANYGGTDILTPLQKAFSLQAGDMKKRVFMLTDGEDDQKNSIIAFARSNCEHMRIHTFGIGGDCDRKLIEGTASAGRGTSSFAVSKDDDLSGLVVNALKRAMLPSLGCEFNFFGKVQKREFFKDEPIKAYQILTKEVFEKA